MQAASWTRSSASSGCGTLTLDVAKSGCLRDGLSGSNSGREHAHLWLNVRSLASQVGSKNAAFFMGRAVKVCTKRAGDRKVHQLCIDAEKLEDRYRNHEVR